MRAACANSPILKRWRLRDETRSALLEQALDDRSDDDKDRPSRAAFGTGMPPVAWNSIDVVPVNR